MENVLTGKLHMGALEATFDQFSPSQGTSSQDVAISVKFTPIKSLLTVEWNVKIIYVLNAINI